MTVDDRLKMARPLALHLEAEDDAHTIRAKVYALLQDGHTHSWMDAGMHSADGAAALLADQRATDPRVKLQFDWRYRNQQRRWIDEPHKLVEDWPNALVEDLMAALARRGVALEPTPSLTGAAPPVAVAPIARSDY